MHAPAIGEARLEGVDLRRRVAGGGRQEQHARLLRGAQRQHEVVEQRVGRLHREAAAAHREDLALLERDLLRCAHGATPGPARRPDRGATGRRSPAAATAAAARRTARRRGRRVATARRGLLGRGRLGAEVADVERRLDDAVVRRARRGRRQPSGRELTTRCRRVRRKCRATPSSAAKPGAHAVADEAVVLGASRRLGVVVHAVRVRQQAEATNAARRAVEGAQRLVEPAQRAGRRAAQHDALAPGAAQHVVEAVCAPSAEHADDVTAADVDQILREQVAGEVVLDAAGALVAAEQRDVAGVAARGEAAVEAHDVVVGVARGGRQKADARAFGVGQRQHVVVEQRAVALHREAAASEGDDLWRSRSHRFVLHSLARYYSDSLNQVRLMAANLIWTAV